MALTVRELIAKITLKGDAGDKLAKFGLAMNGAKAALDIFVGAMRIARAAIRSVTQDIVDEGDQIQKTSIAIGISAEMLQEFSTAAEFAGTNVKALTKGFLTLSKNLNDARIKGTGPFLDSLDQLGIKIEEFDRLSPDEVFLRMAEEISKLEDPTTQAGIAMDVFGGAGKKLLPLLKQGKSGINALRKEARELGIAFTDDAADAAADLTDEQLRLNKVVKALKTSLGVSLFPVIMNVTESLREFLVANRDIIQEKFVEFVEDIIDAFKETDITLDSLLEEFKEFGPALGTLADTLGTVVKLMADFVGFISDAVEQFTNLDKAFEDFIISSDNFIVSGVVAGFDLITEATGLDDPFAEARSRAGQETEIEREAAAKSEKRRRRQALKDTDDVINQMIRFNKDVVAGRARAAALDEQRKNRKRAVARRKGGGKKKEDKGVSDEELLALIAQAGATGASLTDLIGDRKIEGGPPPVITVTITNNTFNVDAPIENTFNGIPGQTVDEILEIVDTGVQEGIQEVLVQTMEEMQPVTAR